MNPVYAFIDPGEELKVDIMRQKALPKVDKMIFVSVHVSEVLSLLTISLLFLKVEEKEKNKA